MCEAFEMHVLFFADSVKKENEKEKTKLWYLDGILRFVA